ncbi:hypothetical protein NYZ99_04900 [Maribacter litopenaei]|uniref:Lipoprotein n=1 Tax=Maribacter litopenaei TaxID=2976127 RepID=A0ABY5YAM5_9FLAO|nr:hypothetical protein [Maribacter litopenaei]UWX55764.1 hypothetical protein NYZ99_04900 [Maribacter litopenaei]
MKNIIKCIYLILPMITLILSCNSSNQTEKEYIKNLEEKNRLLEQEITDLKNNTKEVQSVEPEKVTDKDFFTIGSTEKKVLEVMGNPTGYNDNGRFGKVLWYGLSTVKLENGKVVGYDNIEGNLKINIAE